jgi:hypothetical protein
MHAGKMHAKVMITQPSGRPAGEAPVGRGWLRVLRWLVCSTVLRWALISVFIFNDDNDRCRAKGRLFAICDLDLCLITQEALEDLICLAEVLKPSA